MSSPVGGRGSGRARRAAVGRRRRPHRSTLAPRVTRLSPSVGGPSVAGGVGGGHHQPVGRGDRRRPRPRRRPAPRSPAGASAVLGVRCWPDLRPRAHRLAGEVLRHRAQQAAALLLEGPGRLLHRDHRHQGEHRAEHGELHQEELTGQGQPAAPPTATVTTMNSTSLATSTVTSLTRRPHDRPAPPDVTPVTARSTRPGGAPSHDGHPEAAAADAGRRAARRRPRRRHERVRRHPRRRRARQPPAAHDDPEQPRRRLRPDRPRRGARPGGRGPHRSLRGLQRHRGLRQRRDAAAAQRGRRRRPHDDDGSRRGGRGLHQQVRRPGHRLDAAGPAHRGAGGPHGPRRLPLRDRRRPRGGLEGRPELGRGGRRLHRRRPRPPLPHAAGRHHRGRAPRRPLHLLRRRRPADRGPARLEDRRRHHRARARSRASWPTGRCGCSPPPATSGCPTATCRR